MYLDLNKYAKKAREAAAEGCVLLENRNQALPLRKGERCAVFGRIQNFYYKSGTGSGGLVNTPYVYGILDGLRAAKDICIDETLAEIYQNWEKEHPVNNGDGWAKEPWCQEEMPVSDTLVLACAARNDAAVVIIGRTAGEDRDNTAEKGSYYLTEAESEMLHLVCKYIPRTIVVLNVGNIIDMSWVKTANPAAVLYAWQGGMEGGMGVADVLTGVVNPSGKLADTIADSITAYPSDCNFYEKDTLFYQEDIYVGYRYFETAAKDKVQYPFGFGLSYTTFEVKSVMAEHENKLIFNVSVTNTGSCAGKEVVQVYLQAPQGKLGKPLFQLVGFEKTETLRPTEKTEVRIVVEKEKLASYDDSGLTGHPYCYVLEEGEYRFFVGTSVRACQEAGRFIQKELAVTEVCSQCMAPVEAFDRIKPVGMEDGTVKMVMEAVPLSNGDREYETPTCLPYGKNQGWKLRDVSQKKVDLETFIAQISDEDLCVLVRSEGMNSKRVTAGTAAAFGGVSDSLLGFGIPAACCTDGPSGMRFDSGAYACSLPNGTLLACTFNKKLVEELFIMEGMEMCLNHIDTLLGPGMNIHRHPLNGRNFEYFSEDPYLSGQIAAAELRGMAKSGVTGTIKHFCGNNREFHRTRVNSVVSERALREIYLKGFEIAVKEGGAYSIMTTYGAVNGIWTAGSYDQNTRILREEWGYDGVVMTDWWADINSRGTEPSQKQLAAMIRAQNDMYMVTANPSAYEDDMAEALAEGRLTRAELVRSAANILRFILRSPVMKRV